jgi:hypothetical protein
MQWSTIAIIVVVVIVLIIALEWNRRRHYQGAVFGYFTNAAYSTATFPLKGAALIALRGELCIVEPNEHGVLMPKMFDMPAKNAIALSFNGTNAPSGRDALSAEWDDVTLYLVPEVKGAVERWSANTPMVGAVINGASSEPSVAATTVPSTTTKWIFHPISPATAWSMRDMAKETPAPFLDMTKYPAWFKSHAKLQEAIKLGKFTGMLQNMKFTSLTVPTTTINVSASGLAATISGTGRVALIPTDTELVFRAVNVSDQGSALTATSGTVFAFAKGARDDAALSSTVADTDAARWKLAF